MKWIVGEFAHETNTFSTVPTDLDAFRAQAYVVGEEVRATFAGTKTPVGGFLDVIDGRGDEAVLTVGAHATPSGLVTREAYETISAHIVEAATRHRDADGILLALHGAMVCEGIDDGEGHLLRRVREAAGGATPIVVVLDLHSHITEEIVEAATLVIGYQKYPHTDTYERGVEAAEAILRIARGDSRPVAALEKPPMAPVCGTCHTQSGFYKALWEDALRPKRPESIVATSLFAGFTYADIPPMGFAVLVYAEEEAVAREEASRLAKRAWEGREAFAYTPTPVDEAVRRAKAVDGAPVVIADISDNPGGGGSNDGVEILRELLKQGVTRAAVATIYDPAVVMAAEAVGINGTLKTSLGAKTDDLHGKPIDVEGRVRLIYDGKFQYRGPMTQGAWGDIGKTAVIDLTGTAEKPGIQVIVCSKRLQARDPEIFRSAGIDPMDNDILVVKSAVHFRAAFEPLAAEVIIADAPGLTTLDLRQFNYTRIRRPLWPIDG